MKSNNKSSKSKQTHYNKYFEENKNSCCGHISLIPIWIGINDIICPQHKKKLNSSTSIIDEGKTITNSENIVEHFNKFFTKISTNLQKKWNTKVLRQHWSGLFLVQCCLESFGQHCTRFLLIQCWSMANRQLSWEKCIVAIDHAGTTLHYRTMI